MFDLIRYATPFFVLFLAVEWFSLREAGREESAGPRGYALRDTVTSLTMGIGNQVVDFGWKLVAIAGYAAVYDATPLRMPRDAWWSWAVLFVADDVAYYWYHRASHEVRLFWASHVVHHSSEHYNFSTALRQPWVPMTTFPFWLPLAAVGFSPWMILLQQSISLVYQFFLHTERVDRLPRAFESVLNTPSHHRAHHGANDQYLDRNYGGILILWDRLFHTFEPEGERVRYGLTHNVGTYHPVTVAFHEYAAIGLDVRAAVRWRDRAGYALVGPGWRPRVA